MLLNNMHAALPHTTTAKAYTHPMVACATLLILVPSCQTPAVPSLAQRWQPLGLCPKIALGILQHRHYCCVYHLQPTANAGQVLALQPSSSCNSSKPSTWQHQHHTYISHNAAIATDCVAAIKPPAATCSAAATAIINMQAAPIMCMQDRVKTSLTMCCSVGSARSAVVKHVPDNRSKGFILCLSVSKLQGSCMECVLISLCLWCGSPVLWYSPVVAAEAAAPRDALLSCAHAAASVCTTGHKQAVGLHAQHTPAHAAGCCCGWHRHLHTPHWHARSRLSTPGLQAVEKGTTLYV